MHTDVQQLLNKLNYHT